MSDRIAAEEALDLLWSAAKGKRVYVGYPKTVQDVVLAKVEETTNKGFKLQVFVIVTVLGFIYKGWVLWKNDTIENARIELITNNEHIVVV